MSLRVAGERLRARRELARLRALLDSAEAALNLADVPPGSDVQQAVVMSAYNFAASVSRVDAYMRVVKP